MRNSWRVVVIAGVLFIGGAAQGARAEVEDVACGSLEHLALGGTESYDETICMAGDIGGMSSGESRRPVGVDVEVIIAYSRATFAIARFDSTNYRTYMELPSVREHVEGSFPGFAPRNWGEERRHERFMLADVEARISDGSPYLACVGFLARLRPAGLAPGYREALGGFYCAMDTLTPTNEEVAAFLDSLEF